MAGKVSIPNKLEMLATAKEYYIKIIDTISDIESGMTESDACKKHGIGITEFRQHTLYKRKLTYDVSKPFNPVEFYKEPTWKLYEEILGLHLTVKDLDKLPPDLDTTLEAVLIDTLSPRQLEAIRAVYFEELSFAKAGEKLGVTRVDVRNLVNKSLRKLRHPSKSVRVVYGDKFINELNSRRIKCIDEILEKNSPKESDFLEAEYSYMEDSIDELSLPARAYNCLRRAGYNTVGAIVEAIDKGKLWQVRNLGVRSMSEVVAAVNAYILESQGKPRIVDNFHFPKNL